MSFCLLLMVVLKGRQGRDHQPHFSEEKTKMQRGQDPESAPPAKCLDYDYNISLSDPKVDEFSTTHNGDLQYVL